MQLSVVTLKRSPQVLTVRLTKRLSTLTTVKIQKLVKNTLEEQRTLLQFLQLSLSNTSGYNIERLSI